MPQGLRPLAKVRRRSGFHCGPRVKDGNAVGNVEGKVNVVGDEHHALSLVRQDVYKRQGREVRRILVALDPFQDVCQEAADWGAELLVTHHPLIFQPPRSITDDTSVGRCILFLAARDMAAINAHTNLDCAPGGVNDCLAGALGLEETVVLNPSGTDGQGRPWGLLRAGRREPVSLEAFLEQVKQRLGCPGPVSYTHLDVYKRQILVRYLEQL